MSEKETVLYDIEKHIIVEFLTYLDEEETLGVYETDGFDLEGNRYESAGIYIQRDCYIYEKELL